MPQTQGKGPGGPRHLLILAPCGREVPETQRFEFCRLDGSSVTLRGGAQGEMARARPHGPGVPSLTQLLPSPHTAPSPTGRVWG